MHDLVLACNLVVLPKWFGLLVGGSYLFDVVKGGGHTVFGDLLAVLI